ncbi:MAG: TVP38/TMEM64 family protein, partial [Paracoccaceae bacterium]
MTRPALFLFLGLAVALLGVLLAIWGPDATAARSAIAALDGWRTDHPLLLGLLYFLAYVAVTTLSLPFAVWMTLGAGALFGFWGGVVIVSLAATAGATGAFLAARYFLRDAARRRAGDRLSAIDAGIRRDGALYLFSLRLIPAVPFFLVNLLMGLTAIPAGTFAAVSFIGMLPATALYVNAGTQLAAIGKPGDILSPGIVISLLLLGVFPWIARSLLGRARRRG